MESFEDSNCPSMSDSLSLYERYMRSFNVVDNFVEENNEVGEAGSNVDLYNSNSEGNIDLSAVNTNLNKHNEIEPECNSLQPVSESIVEKSCTLDDLCKLESPCTSLPASLLETSSVTENDKSTDVRVSEKSEGFKPVFITSTMENSNNAVDSLPMFRDVGHAESVFKLPISELSFNGTLKHVQKLKPIVDPISALTSTALYMNDKEKDKDDCCDSMPSSSVCTRPPFEQKTRTTSDSDDRSTCESIKIDKITESSGDSQYEGFNPKKEDGSNGKWNLDQSYSSLEASFDSGVRSPDMFSEDDDERGETSEPFWSFLKDFELYEKRKIRKIEETLQGILPPPSVTTLKTDVTQMLKKYYCFLPAFNDKEKINSVEANSTPTKKVSFVHILTEPTYRDSSAEVSFKNNLSNSVPTKQSSKDSSNSEFDPNISNNDKSIDLKMSTETEAMQCQWPDVLKCKYHDVYYNVTNYSEKYELLIQKYRERFVGAETDTSVNIYSGGLQSPSSATKRKALRLKMAQAKSPGRRLSHLARRRQAFCSAATINEKAQASTAKMVLIDKKKLINSSDRKSPRRRTPGKRTPIRRTPGKKTPAKTPKSQSGGSSRKKAMRRLLLDSDSLSKTQPTRETLKRALFISPENRKTVPASSSSSVPHQAMKSKRALFGSPVRPAETKSCDGSQSDMFLKRKRDSLDDVPESSRSKIAKSLSFGGDTISSSQHVLFNRRASEMLSSRNTAELNETHKKKLLWAVSEALRVHGWRMSSPGFREKASALARLTRKLLSLPPHAAKLAAPKLSTSETMLKLARQYVFAIIQGRTVEECFHDEQMKLASECNKISGYISATAYQQIKAKQMPALSTFTSQIKENTCNNISLKQEQPRSASKNILQDKLVNIDTNSNSSSGFSMLDKTSALKSNSMPSFEEAAKMRARRQISFDNIDFPKR